MTRPKQDYRPTRDNETEHANLSEKAGELAGFIPLGNAAGLEESVREAAFSLDEEQHNLLEERFHDVEKALKEVLGEKRVTVRAIHHIHSRLIGVRILELTISRTKRPSSFPWWRTRLARQTSWI